MKTPYELVQRLNELEKARLAIIEDLKGILKVKPRLTWPCTKEEYSYVHSKLDCLIAGQNQNALKQMEL